jgi:hypothetical protein
MYLTGSILSKKQWKQMLLYRHQGKLISQTLTLSRRYSSCFATNADIIITGRVADPSLFLAPMVYEFSWSLDDL